MKTRQHIAALLLGFVAVGCAGPEYEVEGTLTVRETGEVCDFTSGENVEAWVASDGELRELGVSAYCYLEVIGLDWGEDTTANRPSLAFAARFRELSTRIAPRETWVPLTQEASGGIDLQSIESPPIGCGNDYSGYAADDASFFVSGPPVGEPFDEITIRINHPCAFGELLVFRTD